MSSDASGPIRRIPPAPEEVAIPSTGPAGNAQNLEAKHESDQEDLAQIEAEAQARTFTRRKTRKSSKKGTKRG